MLHTYKWGEWSDCSDRFPGHPESIDAIVAVDADTILTGSSDGLLRVVTIQVRLCARTLKAYTRSLCFLRALTQVGSAGLPVLHVQPHKLVGVLGDHGDFPIETMALREPSDSLPATLLASASHDSVVKFWNLDEMLDVSDDVDEDEDSDDDSDDSDDGGGEAAGARAEPPEPAAVRSRPALPPSETRARSRLTYGSVWFVRRLRARAPERRPGRHRSGAR